MQTAGAVVKKDTIWKKPAGLKALPVSQPVMIQTGGSGTLHAPEKQQSIASYTPLLDERHLTAFLGHIPPSVDDEYIIKLLSLCGELRNWKRVKDPYGKPKDFGFAVFADAVGLLNALRFLANDPKNEGVLDKGMTLPGIAGQEGRQIIFAIDSLAKNHCEIYRRTMLSDQSEIEDKNEKINQLLESIKGAPKDQSGNRNNITADSFLADALGGDSTPTSGTPTAAASASLAAAVADTSGLAYRDIIVKEIENFRASCIKDDLAKRAAQEAERRRLQMRKRKQEEEQISKVAEADKDGDYLDGDYDSEEESAKQTRHLRDMQQKFIKREERWLAKEEERISRIEREMRRESDRKKTQEEDEKYWADKLANFDEAEQEKHEFFTDRGRWIRQRRAKRNRELDQESKDRDMEANIQRRKDAGEQRRVSEKRVADERGHERDREEEADNGEDVERILTMEQRQEAIKAIVAAIPTKRDELFEYAKRIRWDYINEQVHEKLDTFIQKRLKEYIVSEDSTGAEAKEEEEEVKTISKYVLRLVRGQTSPVDMLNELKEALDESEAEMFIIKLFRMIIYESESRYQNLA
ncbi:MAG: hypothetical protein SGCHY_001832 [Lobulomycetales sp.]